MYEFIHIFPCGIYREVFFFSFRKATIQNKTFKRIYKMTVQKKNRKRNLKRFFPSFRCHKLNILQVKRVRIFSIEMLKRFIYSIRLADKCCYISYNHMIHFIHPEIQLNYAKLWHFVDESEYNWYLTVSTLISMLSHSRHFFVSDNFCRQYWYFHIIQGVNT